MSMGEITSTISYSCGGTPTEMQSNKQKSIEKESTPWFAPHTVLGITRPVYK